jgi:DNA-directed RNA polymerase specialized sigma24 family protein
VGEFDAFEELFRSHQRDVYNRIVRLTRDPAAAEDLMVGITP